MKGLPKWMWILLSSVVMTLGPELLDLWTCQLVCLSGVTRKTACPPTTSTGSVERERSGVPVVTDTICIGDMALSGVTEPQESGVIALEYVDIVNGDRALSGEQGSSDIGEPLDFIVGEMDFAVGDMEAFWMMVILCLGGPPLVGMTAVLVNDWVFSVVGLVISSVAVLCPWSGVTLMCRGCPGLWVNTTSPG